ncbi:hypothetical protein EV1_029211 [Malus domestica]
MGASRLFPWFPRGRSTPTTPLWIHPCTWDSEVFRQTRPRIQYGEYKEKSHAIAQTFLLPRGDGDLLKKIPVETYERKSQWYMTPLRTLLSYSSLRK